jgi:hypothetical protein
MARNDQPVDTAITAGWGTFGASKKRRAPTSKRVYNPYQALGVDRLSVFMNGLGSVHDITGVLPMKGIAKLLTVSPAAALERDRQRLIDDGMRVAATVNTQIGHSVKGSVRIYGGAPWRSVPGVKDGDVGAPLQHVEFAVQPAFERDDIVKWAKKTDSEE